MHMGKIATQQGKFDLRIETTTKKQVKNGFTHCQLL